MTFDGSLKEFCIGMTVKEIKEYFKENYNPKTKQIFCNGVYYQLAIDNTWANEDENICDDLWILLIQNNSFIKKKGIDNMKNIYVLILKTNEEKPYNKFCHLVTKLIDDELSWLDIVKEDFPKMTIRGTEEEIIGLVDYLKKNGFEVQIEKQYQNIGFIDKDWRKIMEFAKYYDVSNVVEDMINKKEIWAYPTDDDKYEGVYVCMDVKDFWVCRILNGYDEEYERDEDKYLVERNRISIYDVMDKLHEQYGKKLPVFEECEWEHKMKNKVHDFLDKHKTLDIIKAVLILDDDEGLENWDCCEADSMEEAVEMIDDGFGILKIAC